jgi:hypothetical protein
MDIGTAGAQPVILFYGWSMIVIRQRHGVMITASLLFFWIGSTVCRAQVRDVLCTGGDGNFDAEFDAGIRVRVGAARNGTLATRACAGTLSWDRQELSITGEAAQLDVDGFGMDLGVGAPVVSFQVKKSSSDCCMSYQVYTLEKPPRLLRTITGGDFFSACDRDLDGRVEIWTRDAAAVDGFDNLSLSELDFGPSLVLRFVHGKLLDVSAQFQAYFDEQIAKIKAGLHPQDLQDFMSGGGKLTSSPKFSAEQLHRLRSIKAKVLEIVWSYLYSGREEEAWRSLREMWPAADSKRIRAETMKARARGIRAQTDGELAEPSNRRRKHAPIFDAVRAQSEGKLEVIPPTQILLRRPPDPTPGKDESEQVLDLVVDSAGKVRSVEPVGNLKRVGVELIQAAWAWKFVPAYKDGRPVACRMRLTVSPKQ